MDLQTQAAQKRTRNGFRVAGHPIPDRDSKAKGTGPDRHVLLLVTIVEERNAWFDSAAEVVSRARMETRETASFGTVMANVELTSLQTDASLPLLTLMRTMTAATPRPEVQSRQ
jgi:hypothetical protein